MKDLSRLFAALIVAVAPAAGYADGWEKSVTPYLWMSSVALDTGVDDVSGPSVDFKDILDDLDFAFQIHLEARKDRLGLLLDFTNLQLSARKTKAAGEIDTDSSVFIIEAGGTYALSDEPRHLELLAGVRTMIIDMEVEIETTGPFARTQRESEKETYIDAMVGVRYIWPLNDKWTFAVRGDVASGDSDFSWNAVALFGYQFRESGMLQFGYKHLNLGLEEMGNLDPDMEMGGPMIGYSMSF